MKARTLAGDRGEDALGDISGRVGGSHCVATSGDPSPEASSLIEERFRAS
jgi:hypothetical protein